jgi:hypothetical protein
MADQTVELQVNEGTPQIELQFGFAQFARYRIFLWDVNGKNPSLIGEGVNVDTIPDKFLINEPVSNLNGRFVTWEAIVASPTGGAGQQYSMRATFTQGNKTCADSPFNQQGALNPDPKMLFDKAILNVV